MIERQLGKVVEQRWGPGKAIIILGPRQVGKTISLAFAVEPHKSPFTGINRLDGECKANSSHQSKESK